jgi:hypothetical protein
MSHERLASLGKARAVEAVAGAVDWAHRVPPPRTEIADELKAALDEALDLEGLRKRPKREITRPPQVRTGIGQLGLTAGFAIPAGLVVGSVPLGILAAALAATVAYPVIRFLALRPERAWGIPVCLMLWVNAGAYEGLYVGGQAFAISHLALPAGLLAFASVTREPGTLKRVGKTLADAVHGLPLAFPITMLVLFAMVLTAEVWRVAGQQAWWQLTLLAVVAIGPQLYFLSRKLSDEMQEDFEHVARALDGNMNAAAPDERAERLATETLSRLKEIAGHALEDDSSRSRLKGVFAGTRLCERISLCEEVRMAIKNRIWGRLAVTAFGIGIVFFVYIWVLAAVVVDPVAAGSLNGAGANPAHVLTDPYFSLAGLLAVVATALALAYVITEEDIAKKLSEAYVHEPAKTILLLGVANDGLDKPPASDGLPPLDDRSITGRTRRARAFAAATSPARELAER